MQFHIATEETKFGLSIDEAMELLQSNELAELKNIAICGVMGMATFTDDDEKISSKTGSNNFISLIQALCQHYFIVIFLKEKTREKELKELKQMLLKLKE